MVNMQMLLLLRHHTTQGKYLHFEDRSSEYDYIEMLITTTQNALDVSTEVMINIGIIQNTKRPIVQLLTHFSDQFKDVIFWKKSSAAPHIQQGIMNSLVEFIICFGSNSSRKFENAQFGQGTYWNVIEGANASANKYADIHKATFPTYLPENISTNFVPLSGLMLDMFIGSGTTIIAAERTGRRCFGIELDPIYCDVSVRRYEEHTGKKAVRISG
jgi:DNA modification methylase